jgi:hypothetical protein
VRRVIGPAYDGATPGAVDVGGVVIGFSATDEIRAGIVASVLAGFPATTGSPVGSVSIDGHPAVAPVGTPHDEHRGIRMWVADDGITVAIRDVVGTAVGARVEIHVPDGSAAPAVEAIAPVLLGWVLAEHDRYLVHGAAVASAEATILVLGASGSGKSTLVAAAVEHGWRALSDDMVVLGLVDGSPRVYGLHRVPAVPIEIGGPVVGTGTPLHDPRRRVELPPSLLSAEGGRVAATVLVGHGANGTGELHAAPEHEVVTSLLQSYAGMFDPQRRERFFRVAARVGALPAWRLGHAMDPEQRRAHVGAALARMRVALDGQAVRPAAR